MKNNLLENRFKLEEPVAKGVSGGVFRAKDLETGQIVAVKLLYTPPGADPNFGVRFKREADVLFELSHPHIVKILHSGVTAGGVIYYAMEFINGVTLERYLNARGRLSVHEAADFLDQLASALDAVHAQKIIHRDVTPSNVMVETDSMGRGRVKLIDFGFAKDLAVGASAKGGPATGRLLLGVAAYMSPEVLAGRPATHLSDIHALAVTTTLMLTGKHPFLRDAEVATIAAVLEEQAPALRSLVPDVHFPSELDAVVAQAMAKKPSSRPQSAGEFARNVRAIVGQSENNVGESPSALLRRAASGSGSSAAIRKLGSPSSTGPRSGPLSDVLPADPSPSARLRPHTPPVTRDLGAPNVPRPDYHSVNAHRGSGGWTIPFLGVAVVLGGVLALVNLMAS